MKKTPEKKSKKNFLNQYFILNVFEEFEEENYLQICEEVKKCKDLLKKIDEV